MGGRFSGMEDCLLPSPVIQDSGSTVTVRAAVCLDSGPETHHYVWVSELMYFVDTCDYLQNSLLWHLSMKQMRFVKS